MTSQTYNLDGPKEFPFPHPVRSADQLTVEIVPGAAVAPGDYEVVGVGPTSTQVTVRYPNAPTSGGLQLKITRYVAPERVTQIDSPSDINVTNLNAEFNNVYEALTDFEAHILSLVQDEVDAAIAAMVAAEAARDAAQLAEQGAQTAWDDFRDRYWGAYASDPSTSPTGNPPDTGDLYWNLTTDQWRVWDAGAGTWVYPNSAVGVNYDRRNYIATEGQTTFAVDYDAGFVQVWANGALLPPSDYEASSGTDVVLDEGVPADTEVTVIGLGATAIDVLDGDAAQVSTSTGTQLLPAALDDRVVHVPDIATLRALTGVQDGQAVRITDGGTGGTVRWVSDDLSVEVANDPDEDKYIPPTSDLSGASGAWERTPDSDHPLVVLASGQSNMRGVGGGGTFKTRKNVQVWSPDASAFVRVDLNENPVAMGTGQTIGGTSLFGLRNNLAVAFCHRLYEETGRNVYLIIEARTATSIEDGWIGGDPSVYPFLKSSTEAALAALGRDHVDVMLWHQGEANTSDATPDDYYASLQALLDKLRAESWFPEATPFVAGELVGSQTNSTSGTALRFLNYSEYEPSCSCASSLGLQTETDGHIDGPSLWEFGYHRYWDAYVQHRGSDVQGSRSELYDYYAREGGGVGMCLAAKAENGMKVYPRPSPENNYSDPANYEMRIMAGSGNRTLVEIPKGDDNWDQEGFELRFLADLVTQIPEVKLNAQRLRLGATGYLDAPGTPAFEATLSANKAAGYPAGGQLIFDDVLMDNTGDYDPVTGDFTLTEDGIFLVTLTVKLAAAATQDHYFRVTAINAVELGVAFIPAGAMIGTVTFRIDRPGGNTIQVYGRAGYGSDEIDSLGSITRFAAHRVA